MPNATIGAPSFGSNTERMPVAQLIHQVHLIGLNPTVAFGAHCLSQFKVSDSPSKHQAAG
jgi:hypothetical protein